MPLTPPPGLSARRTFTEPDHKSSVHHTDRPAGLDEWSAAGQAGGPATADRHRAELIAEIHALRGMVASLPLIEQAKGALMLSHGITADAAFALLHEYAEREGISIRDLAAELMLALTGQTHTPARSDPIDQFLTALPEHPHHREADDSRAFDRDDPAP